MYEKRFLLNNNKVLIKSLKFKIFMNFNDFYTNLYYISSSEKPPDDANDIINMLTSSIQENPKLYLQNLLTVLQNPANSIYIIISSLSLLKRFFVFNNTRHQTKVYREWVSDPQIYDVLSDILTNGLFLSEGHSFGIVCDIITWIFRIETKVESNNIIGNYILRNILSVVNTDNINGIILALRFMSEFLQVKNQIKFTERGVDNFIYQHKDLICDLIYSSLKFMSSESFSIDFKSISLKYLKDLINRIILRDAEANLKYYSDIIQFIEKEEVVKTIVSFSIHCINNSPVGLFCDITQTLLNLYELLSKDKKYIESDFYNKILYKYLEFISCSLQHKDIYIINYTLDFVQSLTKYEKYTTPKKNICLQYTYEILVYLCQVLSSLENYDFSTMCDISILDLYLVSFKVIRNIVFVNRHFNINRDNFFSFLNEKKSQPGLTSMIIVLFLSSVLITMVNNADLTSVYFPLIINNLTTGNNIIVNSALVSIKHIIKKSTIIYDFPQANEMLFQSMIELLNQNPVEHILISICDLNLCYLTYTNKRSLCNKYLSYFVQCHNMIIDSDAMESSHNIHITFSVLVKLMQYLDSSSNQYKTYQITSYYGQIFQTAQDVTNNIGKAKIICSLQLISATINNLRHVNYKPGLDTENIFKQDYIPKLIRFCSSYCDGIYATEALSNINEIMLFLPPIIVDLAEELKQCFYSCLESRSPQIFSDAVVCLGTYFSLCPPLYYESLPQFITTIKILFFDNREGFPSCYYYSIFTGLNVLFYTAFKNGKIDIQPVNYYLLVLNSLLSLDISNINRDSLSDFKSVFELYNTGLIGLSNFIELFKEDRDMFDQLFNIYINYIKQIIKAISIFESLVTDKTTNITSKLKMSKFIDGIKPIFKNIYTLIDIVSKHPDLRTKNYNIRLSGDSVRQIVKYREYTNNEDLKNVFDQIDQRLKVI